jgi:hypothetical protein
VAEPHPGDLLVLQRALHMVARFGERNALDPVDWIDVRVARLAVPLHPFV